jgi:hypothetical protein
LLIPKKNQIRAEAATKIRDYSDRLLAAIMQRIDRLAANFKISGAAACATTRLILSCVLPEIEVDKVGVDGDGFKKGRAAPWFR